MAWEVRLMGSVAALDAGDACEIGGPNQQVLLAALALSPGRVVGVERLVDVLWSEAPPASARRSMQVYVSRLRSSMGPSAPILSSGSGYTLDVERRHVDLLAFHDDAVAGLDRLATDPVRAASLLSEVGLRWSEPLAGIDVSAALGAQLLPFRALSRQVERGLASAQIDAGDAQAAVRSLEELVVVDSTDEDLWFQLARGLVALDQRRAALDAIKRARRSLRDELGLDLGDRLARYEVAVMNGEAAEPVAAVCRGTQAQGLQPQVSRLPSESNGFVDRPEVDIVHRRIVAGGVVSLVGPGGIGKSRTAVEAARRNRDAGDWADGVWFVDLAALPAGSADVAAHVATTIGLRSVGAASLPSLLAYLSGRSMLLVLDNCEHVRDGVRDLLTASMATESMVAVLATSRTRLDIAAERVVPIETMSPAASIALLETRMSEVGAGPFASDDSARLCEALDHYPLAVELAAAWTRSLSPLELVERLSTHSVLARPRTLTSDPVDSPMHRHDSLANALDWSLSEIGEGAVGTLHRATVFDADFDLAAAEAVLGAGDRNGGGGTSDGDVLGDLSLLVEHHLVSRDHQRRRYRLLEPIRQTVRVPSHELDAAAGRHAQHYAAVAKRVEQELYGPGEAAAWGLLRNEQVHIRSAVRWAAEVGDVDLLESMMHSLALLPVTVAFNAPGDWAADALATLGCDPLDAPAAALAAAGALVHAERVDECDALLGALDGNVSEARLRAILLAVRTYRDVAAAPEVAEQLEIEARVAQLPCLILHALLHRFEPASVAFANELGMPSARAWALIFAYFAMDDVERRSATQLLEESYRLALASDNTAALSASQALLSGALIGDGQLARGVRLLRDSIESSVSLRSADNIWGAIDAAANVLAVSERDPYAVMVLWSAADRVESRSIARRERGGRLPGLVAGALSDDERRAAEREGAGLSMDEAAIYARKTIDQILQSVGDSDLDDSV